MYFWGASLFLLLFSNMAVFFLPGFNTFAKQGSLWSAEPKCSLSDEWHSHSWLARASSEAAFLQQTVAEAECLTQAHTTTCLLWPSLGRLLPSTSLGIRRRRRQHKHWGLLQTWIESSFWMRNQILCTLVQSGLCHIQRHCQACCPFSPHQVQHHLLGDLLGWGSSVPLWSKSALLTPSEEAFSVVPFQMH